MPDNLDWAQTVKIELVKRHMTIQDLAREVGMTREYVSAVVNGRAHGKQARQKISHYLNIPN